MAQRSCGHADGAADTEFARTSCCTNCWIDIESSQWPDIEPMDRTADMHRENTIVHYAFNVRPLCAYYSEEQQQMDRAALNALKAKTSAAWWHNHGDPRETINEALREVKYA